LRYEKCDHQILAPQCFPHISKTGFYSEIYRALPLAIMLSLRTVATERGSPKRKRIFAKQKSDPRRYTGTGTGAGTAASRDSTHDTRLSHTVTDTRTHHLSSLVSVSLLDSHQVSHTAELFPSGTPESGESRPRRSDIAALYTKVPETASRIRHSAPNPLKSGCSAAALHPPISVRLNRRAPQRASR
jgi:hypothetical protein